MKRTLALSALFAVAAFAPAQTHSGFRYDFHTDPQPIVGTTLKAFPSLDFTIEKHLFEPELWGIAGLDTRTGNGAINFGFAGILKTKLDDNLDLFGGVNVTYQGGEKPRGALIFGVSTAL